MSEQKKQISLEEYKSKPEREIKKLTTIAEINPGSINDEDFNFEEIKYLDISSTNKGFIEELKVHSLDDAPSRAKRTVKTGDTVISRVRPIREQFTFIDNPPENLVVSTGFVVLRPKEIDEKYLYYATTCPQMIKWMDKNKTGSAYPAINISEIKKGTIPVPPRPIQRKIGSILYNIDSKTEVNNRINQLLEKIAQAIFKEWFVDFGPYEEFKDSELGVIPKEFEVKKLKEIMELEYGKGLPEREREGTRYPVYGSNGQVDTHKEKLVNGPGIIVGRKGTIGTVTLCMDDFWPIDTTFYVAPKREFDILFYYHLLKQSIEFGHLGSDSAVPGLNRNIALDQKVVIPPEGESEKFSMLIKDFYKKKKNLTEENEKMSAMRDTLLPKLMSGEIRVNDLDIK